MAVARAGNIPLPYDAEVEYLESTGTQYINTGVYPDATYTFDSEVTKTVDGNTIYWGVRKSGTYSSNNQQCYLNSNNSTSATDAQKRINLYSTNTSNPNNWNCGYQPTNGKKNTLTGITVVSTMQTMTYPVTLFALNNIGSINTSLGVCRLGKWKAYSNGVLVASFKPVRLNGVGYMYDEVSGTMHANDGTGDFIVGPDKRVVDSFLDTAVLTRLSTISITGNNQGACTDGTYIYQFYFDSNNRYGLTYKIADGTYSTKSLGNAIPYEHGNDMAYNPNNGHLYIAAMSNDGAVMELDTEWNYIKTHYVKDASNAAYAVWAFCFDRNTGHFLSRLPGGAVGVYDQSFTYLSSISMLPTPDWVGTSQGMDTDGDFIYRVFSSPNVLSVSDTQGRYVKSISITGISEPETLMYNWSTGEYYINDHANSNFLYEAQIKV